MQQWRHVFFSEDEELEEDYEEDEPGAEVKENGLLEMLRQHREDGDEEQEYFGGYDEEEYWT